MFDVAKEILKILEDNGYEAYFVGGFVRDYILGINSKDIDIATNARPNDIKKIFDNAETLEKYGAAKLNYKNFNYDITSFREDIKYGSNRKDIEIRYVNTIKEDVLRRDFTINSLYMDKDENIIDLGNYLDDINNKIIKSNKNPIKSITEDPIRILRAIRYAVKLNFKIDSELYKSIKNNVNLLNNISYFRKKEELDKIFKINNLDYFIKIADDLKLKEVLEIDYNNLKYSNNYLDIWSQISFSDNYPFTKKELAKINVKKSIE